MRVLVEVKLEETTLLKKASQAQRAIRELKEFVREFEFLKRGTAIKTSVNQINKSQENETTTAYFMDINEEVIKDQIAAAETAMKPLMDAIEKLDSAITEGILENIPRE